MACATETGRSRFVITKGVYTPKGITSVLRAIIEGQCSREEIIEALIGVQRQWRVRCPACGAPRPVTLFDERSLASLCEVGANFGYDELLEKIERRYATLTLKCPKCGIRGKLDTSVSNGTLSAIAPSKRRRKCAPGKNM